MTEQGFLWYTDVNYEERSPSMRASGVICEFNPFHNGHAYLLSRMRELVGEEGLVVCAMSGRFVQRGEAAMARMTGI